MVPSCWMVQWPLSAVQPSGAPPGVPVWKVSLKSGVPEESEEPVVPVGALVAEGVGALVDVSVGDGGGVGVAVESPGEVGVGVGALTPPLISRATSAAQTPSYGRGLPSFAPVQTLNISSEP